MIRANRTPEAYDALVVGARVAGAATAMLLARAGRTVLLVDRSAPGRDTMSTHALMRPGVYQLKRWGLLDRVIAAGTPAIRRTTFHYAGDAIPVPIRPRDGVDALYAPRRTVLDAILVEAAREAGARVEHGVRLTDLLRDATGRVMGATLAAEDGTRRDVLASIVVGADGVRSTVAECAGADVETRGGHAASVVYGYWGGLDLDGTHWYYDLDVAAGAIPTNDGAACVFVAIPADRYAAERAAGPAAIHARGLGRLSPDLATAVARAERRGVLHAFAGQPGYLRRSHGPGWALVGDAGYFKDPITAHGMTDALRDADLLARAVLADDPDAFAAYQAARDDLSREMLEISDAVASFDWTLEALREIHQRLSRNMTREQEFVAGLRDAEEERAVRSAGRRAAERSVERLVAGAVEGARARGLS